MAQPDSMTTYSGTRHKLGRTETRRNGGREYQLLVAACSNLTTAHGDRQPEPLRNCKRCYPHEQLIATYPTGECPACHRTIRLRADGTIRQHGSKGSGTWAPRNCPGWGHLPVLAKGSGAS